MARIFRMPGAQNFFSTLPAIITILIYTGVGAVALLIISLSALLIMLGIAALGDPVEDEVGNPSPGVQRLGTCLDKLLADAGYISPSVIDGYMQDPYVAHVFSRIHPGATPLAVSAQTAFLMSAMAYESQGKPNAIGKDTPDVGLFQINPDEVAAWMKRNPHRGKTFPLHDPDAYASLTLQYCSWFSRALSMAAAGQTSPIGKLLGVFTKKIPLAYNVALAHLVWMKGTKQHDKWTQLRSLGPRIFTTIMIMKPRVREQLHDLKTNSTSVPDLAKRLLISRVAKEVF
jgi:hypothetical protein